MRNGGDENGPRQAKIVIGPDVEIVGKAIGTWGVCMRSGSIAASAIVVCTMLTPLTVFYAPTKAAKSSWLVMNGQGAPLCKACCATLTAHFALGSTQGLGWPCTRMV